MPSFKLSARTMSLMKKEFDRFQNARRIIHENILNYVADYRQFSGGSVQDRKEFLEKEYKSRTPNLNSLIFNENKILWHVEDIVIVTGLSQPSISRILSKMSKSDGWNAKILSVRSEIRSANNNLIYGYDEEIFDLIIDWQEEKCLERFINPRRGTPSDKNEVIKYWQYLKDLSEFEIKNELTPVELPDIPPMKIKDIFMLVFRKAFTAKILTLSTIFFAVIFELIRRWNFLIIFFALISILVFAASFFMLKIRKGRAGFISDVCAVAGLCVIFLGIGAFSDGIIFTPSGMALSIENREHKINVIPSIERGHKISFEITSDFYDDIKEIYYRTDPKDKFKLTGFNHVNYPILFIEPDVQHGKINLEITYKDTKNKEHGPFKFSFDMDETRVECSKNFLVNRVYWFKPEKFYSRTTIYIFIDNEYADEIVDSVFIGINKDIPDKEYKIDYTSPDIKIDVSKNENLKYVSSYLKFKDGTKSEIRKRDIQIW